MAISQPPQTFIDETATTTPVVQTTTIVDETSDPSLLLTRISLAKQDGGIVVFETPKDIYVTAVEERVTYQQVKNITNDPAGTFKGEIQFVDGGKFAADRDFRYDVDTDILTLNGGLLSGNIVVTRNANLGTVGNVKIGGGSNGQFLMTDGSGNLVWDTPTFPLPPVLPIANGTSVIDIPTASGAITLTTAGTNTWSFNSNASLTLPNVTIAPGRNEQTQLASQRKIIPGSRSSATVPGVATPTVVYTVSSVAIVAFKTSLTIQHQTAGLEFVDVMASRTGPDVGYTVTNWIGPASLPPSDIVVDLDGSGRLRITVTTNTTPTQPAWVTYDAIEYGRPTA